MYQGGSENCPLDVDFEESISYHELNIKFHDITLYELKWRNLRAKWSSKSVGVPSQIEDVL